MGGLPDLLQYYNGGGSLGTPNLYYVIYGRPLRALVMNLSLLWGPLFMAWGGPKMALFLLKMVKHSRLFNVANQFKRVQYGQI